MADLRQVYCKHCGQTFLSDDMEKCGACGKAGGMLDAADPGALALMVAQKQTEPGDPLPAGSVVRFFSAGFAGAFCLVLGLLLLTVPELRSNPLALTVEDAALGMCALAVGEVLLGLAVFPLLLLLLRPRR